MKRVALSNIYGSHMPMRMQMEQFYLARPLRYTFNSYFFFVLLNLRSIFVECLVSRAIILD